MKQVHLGFNGGLWLQFDLRIEHRFRSKLRSYLIEVIMLEGMHVMRLHDQLDITTVD